MSSTNLKDFNGHGSWNLGLHKDGNIGKWELDLTDKQLRWSEDQYKIYGYLPGEINLDQEFFLLRTTHISDISRVTGIIDEAIKSQYEYNFRRRILKKGGRVG